MLTKIAARVLTRKNFITSATFSVVASKESINMTPHYNRTVMVSRVAHIVSLSALMTLTAAFIVSVL
jgi:hypothetical protein